MKLFILALQKVKKISARLLTSEFFSFVPVATINPISHKHIANLRKAFFVIFTIGFISTRLSAQTVPSLSINDVAQNELNAGTSNFTFTVNLSEPAGAGGVTFDIATANNTATTADNDYILKSLTSQTIPMGNSTYTFDVTVNGDITVEPDETFFVNITNVTGASVTDDQGLGSINNDDCTPPATPIITPGGPTTFCAGGSVTLTSSSATGYQWYLDGNPIGGATNQTYGATTSGNYTVTVTENGCTSAPSAATTVLVNPVPDAVATPPSQTICSGSSITTIAFSGNVAGTVFDWSRNNTVNVSGIATSGSGDISGTLTNITNVPQTVTFTIIPTANGCPGPAITATVIVSPPVSGVVHFAAALYICAGSDGNVNVTLNGTPTFTGSFNVQNLTTSVTTTTPNWTSPNIGGPQNITVPAANLPNNTNTPITYRITWNALSDGSIPPCNISLTGLTDIIVNPRPAAVVTAGSTGVLAAPGVNNCPGTVIRLNVLPAPGNTVPSTFTWIATANNGAVLANNTGSNLNYGNDAIQTNLGLLCNNEAAVNPITFTITPFANTSNCPGPVVSVQVNIFDNTGPVLTGALPGGPQGNVCLPPQATYQPATATINALYTDACGGPLTTIFNTATLDNPLGGAATNCSWRWTYNFSVRDGCLNATNVNAVYTGGDITPPSFDAQFPPGFLNRSVNYCDAAGLAAAQALAPTATDNCGPAPVTKTPGIFAVGACPHNGIIINTFVATDGCGFTTSIYTQTITITDNAGPVFSSLVPSSTTLDTGPGANCTVPFPDYVNLANFVGGVNTIAGTTIDCATVGPLLPPTGAITYTQSPAAGIPVMGQGGSILVTITARDVCNNSTSIQFTVYFIDATAPVALCKASPGFGVVTSPPTLPATIYVDLDAQGNSTLTPVFFNNGSFDNCALHPDLATRFTLLSQGPGAFESTGNYPPYTFTCNDVGPQVVRLVVTDESGNQSFCDINVIVRDVTKPVFVSCPGTQSVVKDAGCTSILPNYITTLGIVATDVCGNTPVALTQTPMPGAVFGAGVTSTVVTITAIDVNGNTATCNFTVNFVDNSPPVITCPATIVVAGNTITPSGPNTFTVNTGVANTNCQVVVTYSIPTVTDNCTVFPFPLTITPVRIAGPASGGQFFVGTTRVTWQATDAAGNTSQCFFDVVVVDNTVPVIVTNCTTPRTGNPNTAGCIYMHNSNSWNATATDNCLANVTFRYTATGATTILVTQNVTTLNGQQFNLGVTNVTVIAYDGANFTGNASAPCNFTVTVSDQTPPTLSCPANVIANTNAGPGCAATVPASQLAATVGPVPDVCPSLLEWDVTGATPNSSGVGQMPNFRFSLGVSTVNYRATDAAGLPGVTCTFTVTVVNPGTSTIGSDITIGQNLTTTSTITFTAGGNPNFNGPYTFFYTRSGIPGTQSVTTTGGFNVVTVPQSNAVAGSFVYTLLSAQDAGGCNLPVAGQPTATVSVVAAAPVVPNFTPTIDITGLSFTPNPPVNAGSSRDFIVNIIELSNSPSSGQVVFRVTKPAAYTISVNPTATTAQYFGTVAVQNNDWVIDNSNPLFVLVTLKPTASVPANGVSKVGFTITRKPVTGIGTQNLGVVITNGSGGDINNFDNGSNISLTQL